MFRIGALFAACLSAVCPFGCDRGREDFEAQVNAASHVSEHVPQLVRVEKRAMGTLVQVAAYTAKGQNRDALEQVIERAFDEMDRLERLLSSWKAESDVGRLNRAKGVATKVSPETLEVFEKAQWISRRSQGAFDITFQVMSGLWRFGDAARSSPKVPSKKEVMALRRFIDYRKVELDRGNSALRLPAPMQLSFGGIAKGYIVDRAASVLRQSGVQAFFVQAGGDLLSVGTKPSGKPWKSGIQDPRAPRGSYFATLEFSDHAFSTAGDYARAFVIDGKRYHHIIDPATGFPATNCRSVTVWAPDALTADALDDAVFVLGPEKGLKLVKELGDVEVVIVDRDNRVIVSEGLKSKLEILRPPSEGE